MFGVSSDDIMRAGRRIYKGRFTICSAPFKLRHCFKKARKSLASPALVEYLTEPYSQYDLN